MHDIRLIRDEPDAFDAGLAKRGLAPQAAELIALDESRRIATTRAQTVQAEANAAAKSIGALIGSGRKDEAEAKKQEVAALKREMPAIEEQERAAQAALDAALAAIPNLPASDVPEGPDESANVELHASGTKPAFGFAPREHFDIGAPLGLDFEAAAAISGARFAALRGPVARLHRALGQFMIDLQTQENGYTEVAPPLLVRDEALFGTGQLPKFAEDLFRTTDGRWLIPTAEVSLTNLVREKILREEELPLRFVALTPCFRSEAGAAGRDTRGLIRQHQFDKVELVSITTPEQSADEHERMTRCAETVLDRLGLPYRRMLLCSGDMGFSAVKTFDLEVWLPGQDRYREISSCSNCGDFQARRMAARYRPADPEAKGTRFVHTLNGSGLAVGRALVAVLENYQEADGSVRIPEALRPYMGGMERISA
jgi:seryl-tRNA synthetase